ncbi:MAG: DEAD/DEAH box helicase, partial [Cellvibrionaceae bacterium]|nr:DEAD/DEAH box helicase [Cellvibrionaceae bacterium]
DTGSITLRFFNFNAAMKNALAVGKQIRAYGEIKRGKTGFEIIHPEYKLFTHASEIALAETLTPVYPTTEGLKQLTLRNFTDQALALLDKAAVSELLPDDLYDHQISLAQALKILHRPTPDISLEQLEQGLHPAQKRLILEELLAHNLSMLAIRDKGQQHQSYILKGKDGLKQELLAGLPFTPTNAQSRVVAEIEQDLAKGYPMMRLVQGDVGSGKTLVGALAALSAIEHGHQVALMAPTELLAEQHATSFGNWLEPLGIKVAWLAGKIKG